jgi:hypothetical protein
MVVRRLGGITGLGLWSNTTQLVADVCVDGIGYSEDLMARRHVETYLRIWDVVLALHLLYRLTNMVFTSMRLNNMGIRFAMPRC